MTIRPLQFPTDLIPLGEMLPESFQYPENETWSVQADEQEDLVSTIQNLSRIWPLINILQFLSPTLRDLFRGYVWLEDSRIVGVTMIQRIGSTDAWIVGTVGVLPAYRRHGIAHKLVKASIRFIQDQGGKRIFLDVIKGNIPAYTFYKSLGFEDFSGSVELNFRLEKELDLPIIPEGYVQKPFNCFDWRARYELEKRISPESLTRYEPVEANRYRQSGIMRMIGQLILFAQGMRETCLSINTAGDGELAAIGRYRVSKRVKGINLIRVSLDSDHAVSAPYLLNYMLHKVSVLSPGRRIDLSVPIWMGPVLSAAESAGFKRRLEYIRMGLLI
jgi:ribosomal protein S18 acetylase RimI-like enzyme